VSEEAGVPWKEKAIVDARVELVIRVQRGERVSDLCREFDISRKTAYKFLQRYQRLGPVGMHDQSRAPLQQGRRTSAEIEQLIIELKKQHITWGAKKLKDVLEREHQALHFPARSTFDEILVRNGFVAARRRRQCVPELSTALTKPDAPNSVWAVDYKGQFRLGDGSYCYPLTTSDLYSRFLLGCEAFSDTRTPMAQAQFERLFDTYGLPEVIRSDNGSPFASARGLLGLTRLSAFWISQGIRHERIEPGCPQQNGAHERMHRTLKQETTRPAAKTVLAQQERFDLFADVFNHKRPHEALAMKRPAEVYVPSKRARPQNIFDYPLHDDVLKLSSSGHLQRGRRCRVFISVALAGYKLGLREVAESSFLISFAHLDLGWLNTQTRTFLPIQSQQMQDQKVSPM
jgi:putative transposase